MQTSSIENKCLHIDACAWEKVILLSCCKTIQVKAAAMLLHRQQQIIGNELIKLVKVNER